MTAYNNVIEDGARPPFDNENDAMSFVAERSAEAPLGMSAQDTVAYEGDSHRPGIPRVYRTTRRNVPMGKARIRILGPREEENLRAVPTLPLHSTIAVRTEASAGRDAVASELMTAIEPTGVGNGCRVRLAATVERRILPRGVCADERACRGSGLVEPAYDAGAGEQIRGGMLKLYAPPACETRSPRDEVRMQWAGGPLPLDWGLV